MATQQSSEDTVGKLLPRASGWWDLTDTGWVTKELLEGRSTMRNLNTARLPRAASTI